MAAHHDRRPVLAGDRNGSASGPGLLHQLAEGRHEQMLRRDLVGKGTGARHRLVLGAIDGIVGPPDRLVEPGVADDAGARRMIAGQDGRMAGAGLGRRVALIAVVKHSPAGQPREATGEVRPVLVIKVGRELIDRDDDEQPGWIGRLGCGRKSEKCRGGGEQELTQESLPSLRAKRSNPVAPPDSGLPRRCAPRNDDQPNFARSRSLTSCGLALPAMAFIVWPTKKPNSCCLPPL